MKRRWTFSLSVTFGPEQDEPESVDDTLAYTQAELSGTYTEPELQIGFRP